SLFVCSTHLSRFSQFVSTIALAVRIRSNPTRTPTPYQLVCSPRTSSPLISSHLISSQLISSHLISSRLFSVHLVSSDLSFSLSHLTSASACLLFHTLFK